MGDYMNIKRKRFVYEIIMMLLAVVVVVLTIIQLSINVSESMNKLFLIVDRTIYIIFVIDYFTRLIYSEKKLQFIKNNKIDLITIIPFTTFLRVFRVLRFLKVTEIFRITKVLRAAVFLNNFAKKSSKLVKTNNFNYVLLITLVLIFTSAAFFSIVESKDFGDSLWWSFVTATTVGYGDISPTTTLGRIIAVILMLSGVGFMGMLSATIATYFLRDELNDVYVKDGYKKDIIKDACSKIENFDKLTKEELKDIINVLLALKEE